MSGSKIPRGRPKVIHLIDLTETKNGCTPVAALCRTSEEVYRFTNREGLVTCMKCRRILASQSA